MIHLTTWYHKSRTSKCISNNLSPPLQGEWGKRVGLQASSGKNAKKKIKLHFIEKAGSLYRDVPMHSSPLPTDVKKKKFNLKVKLMNWIFITFFFSLTEKLEPWGVYLRDYKSYWRRQRGGKRIKCVSIYKLWNFRFALCISPALAKYTQTRVLTRAHRDRRQTQFDLSRAASLGYLQTFFFTLLQIINKSCPAQHPRRVVFFPSLSTKPGIVMRHYFLDPLLSTWSHPSNSAIFIMLRVFFWNGIQLQSTLLSLFRKCTAQ